MCTLVLHWGLLYILHGIKHRTFEELATRAHDMELSIVNRGKKDVLILKVRKERSEEHPKGIEWCYQEGYGRQCDPFKVCLQGKEY